MAQVLVLANSRKNSGRCVAGVDLVTRKWVRPVGVRPTGELARPEYTVLSGSASTEVLPGDVVEMPLGQSRASVYHPEDIQIAGPWTLLEHWGPSQVLHEMEHLVQHNAPLFGSADDRLSVSGIRNSSNHSSLQLALSDLSTFFWTTSMSGTPQLRGAVKTGDTWVDLSVTDSRIESELRGHQPTKVANCLLTISLGVPFHPQGATEDFCFKIIAAVMPLS